MSNRIRFSILAVAIASFVVACGSDNQSPSVGRFVDAPVAGIAYRTASQSGLTDNDGRFNYLPGEAVTFTIAGVDLPAVPAAPLVTPLDMAPSSTSSEPIALNVARFLQAIDADNTPSNGIRVSDAKVLSGARTPNWSTVDPSSLLASGVNAPTESRAVEHLTTSLASEFAYPKATLVGRFGNGVTGQAEIVAYHEGSKSEFHVIDTATNPSSIQRISLANLPTTVLANPTSASNLAIAETTDVGKDVSDTTFTAGGVQSVDITGDLLAVAVQANPKTNPGVIAFYSIGNDGKLTFVKKVRVGAQPDSVAFSPDGSKLVVANEGELSNTFKTDNIDPEGSISIISISNNRPADTATTLGFTDFNTGGSRAGEVPQGYRVGRPGATLSQDTEPEYVAISADSKTAIVTLQENNALAVVDLASQRISKLIALGFKDHGMRKNALAPSDRAAKIDSPSLSNLSNLLGVYMPDGVATVTKDGKLYAIIANEGDDRNDFLAAAETARIKELTLDATAFPNATALQQDPNFGRLTVLKTTGTGAFGDTDGDGDYDKLYVLGGRSFSVVEVDSGHIVYDSGADIEHIVYAQADKVTDAAARTALFTGYADRYDNKGPEVESVVVGQVRDKTYAFVGLERTSSFLIYDVTNPVKPVFVQHVQNTTDLKNGDISPEGFKFVPAGKSPNGKALLIVGYGDVSGTVAVYTID